MLRRLQRAWAALAGGAGGAEARAGTPEPRPRILLAELAAGLVESLADAVLIADRRLTVLAWNPALARLADLRGPAPVGRPVRGLARVLDALELSRHLARALEGAVTFEGAVVDGERGERWVEGRCVPLRDAEGRVAAVAAFLRDTTERRRRALLVEAVQAIGRSLTSSLDLDEILDTIASRAREALGVDAVLVLGWEEGAPRMRVLRTAGRLSEHYAATGWLPMAGGPASRAIREGRPVTTADVLADPRFWFPPERRAQIEREGFRAVAAAPLVSRGRVHGALVVHLWTARAFTEEEVHALTLLAEQAAVAIDNARLVAAATRRAARLRELAEVERLLAASLDLDRVFEAIVAAASRLLEAPVVHLWLMEPGGARLRLRARITAPDVPATAMPETLAPGEGVTGLAAAQRAAVFVPDAERDPRVLFRGWTAAGLRTVLAVPIVLEETLVGVLTVRTRLGGLADEEDRALVVSLAGRAALALRHARAYADAVGRAARLRQLAEACQAISASLQAGEILERVAHAAGLVCPGATAALHELDAAQGVLRYVAHGGGPRPALPETFPATAGLAGLVVETRAPVLVDDPARHPRALAPAWWAARPGACYYGVPLLAGDALVGVLGYILPGGPPDAEGQELLRLLAGYAGSAVRNAALYHAERAQAGRLAALATITQRLSSTLELEAVLRGIAESAAALAGVSYARFWVADEERRTLVLTADSGPELTAELPERVVDYDWGGIGWIARHRRPLLLDDVGADPRFVSTPWWRERRMTAYAGFPVLAGDELLAVLVLAHDRPIRFDAETQAVLDMFIAQAGIAIRNARLFQEAQRRREVAEALARVSHELASSLDLERVAALVARRVVELLGGRAAAVYRYEPSDATLHVIGVHGPDAAVDRGATLGPGEGIAGWAVAAGRLVATRDILAEPGVRLSEPLRQRILASGHRAVVGVPLVAGDQIVGALAVTAEAGRVFGPGELEVLQAFADHAALALHNARLYATAQESLARVREAQAQLVHVTKMSALGQLVSGVAHELNNPLSVIIGYGQLLLQRDLPATLRRPLELMVGQADRMGKIVRNLLYFARQRRPERSAVDLNQVIEQALALRAHQLALAKIRVERDFAELPPVSADAQQLQQVVLNLLLNAEQAIAETGRPGRILFRTRVIDDGRAVQAQVIDDGPGIPPDVLPRIFEPFFTTKEVGAGTGLGLSVSYGIVEEHGGRLTATSVPGATTFTLELPVGTPAPARPPTPPGPPLPAWGRTALVVEDEPGVADLVVGLLRDTGWRVDVAGGGREGLERVRRRTYDLIVSDLRMPDGDGEEFYHEAVRLDAALASRFLFITGDTVGGAQRCAALRAARVPVLEKPFSPDRFLEAVRRVVAPATGQAE